MRIVIASRKSDLARIQAFAVGELLAKAHPGLEISYEFRESLGDKNLNDPLWKMPERGVFTQDFYQDLIDGKADMVVHSWKDLPVEDRAGTQIAATLQRADVRDLLLFKRSHFEKANSRRAVKIFSSSPRRAYNLEPFLIEALPFGLRECVFEPVRGNVPTRLQKLIADDEIDGLIVAKAALDRLLSASRPEFDETKKKIRDVLEQCCLMVLPVTRNPAAAAQGALAIEIASQRDDVKELLEKINDPVTFDCVKKEREILSGYGGGCHQKVGVTVLSRPYGELAFVRALTDDGRKIDRQDFISPPAAAIEKVSADKIFPRPDEKPEWFTREKVPAKIPTGPLFVAKAEALPEDAAVPPSQIVWTAGLETWKALSRRGIWVTGSSEGLGESEDARLSILLNGPVNWSKLSHEHGVTDSLPLTATYKLIPRDVTPDLNGRTHFWWSSGSSFELALEKNPLLKNARHFCGPGNTCEIIRRKLGVAADVVVFPTYAAWLKGILK